MEIKLTFIVASTASAPCRLLAPSVGLDAVPRRHTAPSVSIERANVATPGSVWG